MSYDTNENHKKNLDGKNQVCVEIRILERLSNHFSFKFSSGMLVQRLVNLELYQFSYDH